MSDQKNQDLKLVTAAMLVIGDEILSGRTQDKNVSYVALKLGEASIQLKEVRVIPDETSEIVDALNHCRNKYDYVFTSGGIGPTHDDITADSVAEAFGVGIGHDDRAMAILTRHYQTSGIEFNEARKRMARLPDGSSIVENPVSKAPGFRLENVFVMAGVPLIMQAMMDGIIPDLKGGAKMLSRSIGAGLPEGKIAKDLGILQGKYPDVSIGSYPFFRKGEVGTNLVMRSIVRESLDNAFTDLESLLVEIGSEIVETT
ncbi:MAG: molybdopterin-binding protein [Sneathiella sp.]